MSSFMPFIPLHEWIIALEPFLASRHFLNQKAKFMPAELTEFNFEMFSAQSLNNTHLITALNALPVNAKHRLVTLSEAHLLKKNDFEILHKYFENPSPTTVFLIYSAKIDKRLALFKLLQKNNWLTEFKIPYKNQILDHVWGFLSELKIKALPEAIALLQDRIGHDLSLIYAELQKLKELLPAEQSLTPQLVKTFIGKATQDDFYSWCEDVANQKKITCINRLRDGLTQGETPQRLLALLTTHYRKLVLVKTAIEAQPPVNHESLSAKILGLHPFVAKNYLQQSQKYTLGILIKKYERLLTCTLQSRQGNLSPALLLENTLLELVS